MHAELCPVCHGIGNKQIIETDGKTTTGIRFDLCHGCNGKGWIIVPGIDYRNEPPKITWHIEPALSPNTNVSLPANIKVDYYG